MAESFPKTFGRYKLLRKLAQGGMAEIFLAQDERGGICAIKRILPHLAHEESFIRMFIDEARIVSHLDHPNIAAVYDQGKEQGYYYIAMEFVQGHSLLALSERAKATKMELPRGLLAFVVAELLAGLGCAHAARDAKGRHLGIVHRDVTPQNVIIGYDGSVKLIDFGVAKARSRLTQTEAGFTKGKLAYMSPEQARGEDLDGRSDIFSVGIILHEVTTNSRLFNKEGPGGILGAIVNDPIPPPSARQRGYPSELERIVMQALEKDVHRRYQAGEDMRDDLLRFARRERPPPSRTRLSELVHDLFGDPESQADIDRARELAAPTPAEVEAHAAPLSAAEIEASVARSKSRASREPEPPPRDETRMMQAGMVDLRGSRGKSRVETTHPREAVPEASVLAALEPEVPQPRVPWHVHLGTFLRDLGAELGHSWREHRRRWILGLSASVVGSALLLGIFTGAFAALGRWAGSAAEAARAVKSRAGLSPAEAPDAGLDPVRLRLETAPLGATISVDGVGVGAVTPHVVEDLPVGEPLRVELELDGYRPLEETIVLRAGDGLRVERFTLERMEGALRVTSAPSGAVVFIDGDRIQERTPALVEELPAEATVRVEARKRGRKRQSRAVIVPDGDVREVHLELPVDRRQIPSGAVTVRSTPTGCPVRVDDAYAGVTPLVGHEARPGVHRVEVRCEHHAAEVRSVLVDSGATANVSVSARPNVFGYLTIVPRPARGSTVEINGQPVDTPVEFLEVVPGRHVVTVRNRDLGAEKRITVRVRPEDKIKRRVVLW